MLVGFGCEDESVISNQNKYLIARDGQQNIGALEDAWVAHVYDQHNLMSATVPYIVNYDER